MIVTAGMVPVIATAIMLMAGLAYLIFLAYTWKQVVTDRTNGMNKVDELLDRLPKRVAADG